MCRFIVYKGEPLLLADLVTRPSHSLIRQSTDSKERENPLNGDGFGLGWYVPDISEEPCFFTGVNPAWTNQNLRRIAGKTVSPCIFAHVRAASSGLEVTELNCHPFQFGRYLFMHNGTISHFSRIKRDLRSQLSDNIYHAVRGTTDSEHAFATFLNHLPDTKTRLSTEVIAHALNNTISHIGGMIRHTGVDKGSILNCAVTDGNTIAVSRYGTKGVSASLYLCSGEAYGCENGMCKIDPEKKGKKKRFAIIASEPITEIREQWTSIPENHLVTVDEAFNVDMRPIDS